MRYTEADYKRERAICDKAADYAEQFRQKNDWTVIPAEAAKHPDYAAADNDMRGRVEQFEILRDMPERFTAYLENGKPDGVGARLAVTVWTGGTLGTAAVRTVSARRGYTSDRQRYGRATINGTEYAWQGPGAGMYAHFRKLKQPKRA